MFVFITGVRLAPLQTHLVNICFALSMAKPIKAKSVLHGVGVDGVPWE